MFTKSIGSILVLYLNKVQEKLSKFKTKVQKPTFQVKYQAILQKYSTDLKKVNNSN